MKVKLVLASVLLISSVGMAAHHVSPMMGEVVLPVAASGEMAYSFPETSSDGNYGLYCAADEDAHWKADSKIIIQTGTEDEHYNPEVLTLSKTIHRGAISGVKPALGDDGAYSVGIFAHGVDLPLDTTIRCDYFKN